MNFFKKKKSHAEDLEATPDKADESIAEEEAIEAHESEADESAPEKEAESVTPDTAPTNEKKKDGKLAALVRAVPVKIMATFCLIAVVIVALVVSVNLATRDKIAENAAKAKSDAVLSVFKAGDRCSHYETREDGSEIYLVYKNDAIIGYCVTSTRESFNGTIDLLVAIDSAGNTVGVKVPSGAYKSDLGAKAASPSFLNLFVGKSHDDPVSDIDTIAGATISSASVIEGVVAAHEINIDLSAVAEILGVSLVIPEKPTVPETVETESEADTETVETESEADTETEGITAESESSTESETTKKDTETESDPEEESDLDFIDNTPGGGYFYGVEDGTTDDRYYVEVSVEVDSDSDEEEEPAPETEEEETTDTTVETTKAPETTTETTKATTKATTKKENKDPKPSKTTASTTEPATSGKETTAATTKVTETKPVTTTTAATEPTPETTTTSTTATEPVSPDTSVTSDTEEPTPSETTEDPTPVDPAESSESESDSTEASEDVTVAESVAE